MAVKKSIISFIILISLTVSMAGSIGPARAADPIEQFVERLYSLVLGRSSEPSGLQYWSGVLRRGEVTGASVAQGFFFSPELTNRQVSNEQFVDLLYRSLMNREADAEGRAFWINYLHSGRMREEVFAGFVNSPEFNSICAQFGIIRGVYTPPPGGNIRVFVTRLYRLALQREPDISGLNSWTSSLLSRSTTGAAVAYGFIFSNEMLSRNLSNDAYVEILYSTLLGRGSDAAGKAHWVNRLQSGNSRYSIFSGFVTSSEFDLICRNHGITRGTVPPPTNSLPATASTPSLAMVNKTWNLITEAHFRGISDRPEHIAGIIGNLQAEAGQALCPFQQQVSNQVGIGIMQWSFGRRTNMETYLWSNGVGLTEFITEVNKHTTHVCNNPQAVHPPALLDRVLQLQVNFMFQEFRTTERGYMNYIDFPVNRTGIPGARSYAELFCSLSLRPGDGGPTNNILDEGVLEALQASPYAGGAGQLNRMSYSNLNGRRNNAERVFQQFLTNHR